MSGGRIFSPVLMVLLGLSCFAAVLPAAENQESRVSACRAKASAGDAAAQNELGLYYVNGHGVKKDAGKAVELFRKSAAQKYPDGIYDLAICYYNGTGAEKDLSLAVKLLQEAAELNSPEAASLLGACYLLGHGVGKDEVKGFEWVRRAAEKNVPQALFNLARCYELGLGTETDLKLAEKWYLRAANARFPGAGGALDDLLRRKEPEVYTDAGKIPPGYRKFSGCSFSSAKNVVSFSLGGKTVKKAAPPKKTLRSMVLEKAKGRKADIVLILQEEGDAANGHIEAEFFYRPEQNCE